MSEPLGLTSADDWIPFVGDHISDDGRPFPVTIRVVSTSPKDPSWYRDTTVDLLTRTSIEEEYSNYEEFILGPFDASEDPRVILDRELASHPTPADDVYDVSIGGRYVYVSYPLDIEGVDVQPLEGVVFEVRDAVMADDPDNGLIDAESRIVTTAHRRP